MTSYSLVLHPDFPAPGIRDLRAYAETASGGSLRLGFLVSAPLRDLHLPAGDNPARRDGLWRTTCFELFVQLDRGYAEFNLSPSGSWAAYRFDGYRAGVSPLDVTPPSIDQNGGSDWYELVADIPMPAGATGPIGLSAVIESSDGTKSYWALAHAPGPPDFHNPACFIATLPAPERP